MTVEMIALIISAIVTIILPLVVMVVTLKKNKEHFKSLILLFLCGGLIYAVMQWGIKEHGLKWLFNNTELMQFMKTYYILYLFLVAFVGATLTVIGLWVVVRFLFKCRLSVCKALSLALGYIMTEGTWLVGARSINTIIEMAKGSTATLDVSTGELFLSSYERVLLLIIEVALVVVFSYFVQRKMPIRGIFITILCFTCIAFFPGFFIAFTLPDYLEVFDRSIALTMVYIILTAAAFASVVILRVCKNLFDED
ncbi:MAG: hypothetical protein E7264_10840 [Lachnospiraceae bacterium]|nr:hypothetical protein [Lachnospiraceae bacterium]